MTTVSMAVAFRFDAPTHTYWDLSTGEEIPHITGFLMRGGITDDLWFKDEHAERGRAVHSLCADFDLGALTDVAGCDSKYRGFLLAHVAAMQVLRPRLEILAVEEPLVHSVYRFGGRPDRDIRFDGARGVFEIKSGAEDPRAHGIQTALQAILVAEVAGLPAESLVRYVLYVKRTGRWKLIEMKNRRDFDTAYQLIRQFGGR